MDVGCILTSTIYQELSRSLNNEHRRFTSKMITFSVLKCYRRGLTEMLEILFQIRNTWEFDQLIWIRIRGVKIDKHIFLRARLLTLDGCFIHTDNVYAFERMSSPALIFALFLLLFGLSLLPVLNNSHHQNIKVICWKNNQEKHKNIYHIPNMNFRIPYDEGLHFSPVYFIQLKQKYFRLQSSRVT